MRSVKCSVHPGSVSTLKELIDWHQMTGSPLKFEIAYRGNTMDDIQFSLIVCDNPQAVFLSGSAKIKGGAGGGHK